MRLPALANLPFLGKVVLRKQDAAIRQPSGKPQRPALLHVEEIDGTQKEATAAASSLCRRENEEEKKPAPYFDWTEEEIAQAYRATGNGPIAFTRPGPRFDAAAAPEKSEPAQGGDPC